MHSFMELHAIIDDKSGIPTIIYDDQFYKKQIESFKLANLLHRIVIRFEVVDKPEYYLHKYYRGFLLPDLASAMGERDVNSVHMEMKKRFLYVRAEKLKDVPARLRSRCNYYIENRSGEDVLVGFTPSTGDITHKEMLEYIKAVEHVLFVDIGGHIDPRHQGVANDYRVRGFTEEK